MKIKIEPVKQKRRWSKRSKKNKNEFSSTSNPLHLKATNQVCYKQKSNKFTRKWKSWGGRKPANNPTFQFNYEPANKNLSRAFSINKYVLCPINQILEHERRNKHTSYKIDHPKA